MWGEERGRYRDEGERLGVINAWDYERKRCEDGGKDLGDKEVAETENREGTETW